MKHTAAEIARILTLNTCNIKISSTAAVEIDVCVSPNYILFSTGGAYEINFLQAQFFCTGENKCWVGYFLVIAENASSSCVSKGAWVIFNHP